MTIDGEVMLFCSAKWLWLGGAERGEVGVDGEVDMALFEEKDGGFVGLQLRAGEAEARRGGNGAWRGRCCDADGDVPDEGGSVAERVADAVATPGQRIQQRRGRCGTEAREVAVVEVLLPSLDASGVM
jgi:hypothetical protein